MFYVLAAKSSLIITHVLPATGSVTTANYKELAAQPDVDGFLVGGASLKVMKNLERRLMSCFFFLFINQRNNELATRVADYFQPYLL